MVTGGAGFIGSALVRKIVRETARTVVDVDKLTYAGNLESLAEIDGSPQYRFEHADIGDAPRMREMFARHFRPHYVYGEHQNLGDRYRNVIGIFMNQLMCGQPLTVFGDGTQTRAFSYIDDVAPQIARSVDVSAAYGETINVGADTPYTVEKLALVVAHAFDTKPTIKHWPARNEVQHAYADHEKARELFGATGMLPLEVGIARMAEWAKRIGARQGKAFEGLEVTRDLPPSWGAPKNST